VPGGIQYGNPLFGSQPTSRLTWASKPMGKFPKKVLFLKQMVPVMGLHNYGPVRLALKSIPAEAKVS